MRIFYAISGITLILLALFQLRRFIYDDGYLTDYGRGYFLGSFLLFMAGAVLVYFGFRKQRKKD